MFQAEQAKQFKQVQLFLLFAAAFLFLHRAPPPKGS
jgi:hypothetical protein